MRGRLSSKQMETAYIRSMVKHLTSKDLLDVDGGILKENATQNEESVSDIINGETSMSVAASKLDDVNSVDYFPNQKQKPSQQPKKQVRRRLHTSKPYQERLLNMAEARREIVTALKFHRASMKQQEAATATTPASVVTANSYWPISTITPPPPPPPPLPQPPPPPPPPPLYDYDNENFVLPSQTLGLNLNFKNFCNLDTNLYRKPISIYSTSSTSSTQSSSSSAALSVPVGYPNSSGSLHHQNHHHHAMDDDEMEEIRSVGKQHQIEWNDTMNLMTSARWCNFLKTMEIEGEEGDEFDGFHEFDQVMKFPQWLISSNESSCLQQHFDDDFSDAYFQDPALPCMEDIGEIEAMDGEWLA